MPASELQAIAAAAKALQQNPTCLRYLDRMRIENAVFRVLQHLIARHSSYRIRGFNALSSLELQDTLLPFHEQPWFKLVQRGCELVAVTQSLSIGNPYDVNSFQDLSFGGREGLVRKLGIALCSFAQHVSDEFGKSVEQG